MTISVLETWSNLSFTHNFCRESYDIRKEDGSSGANKRVSAFNSQVKCYPFIHLLCPSKKKRACSAVQLFLKVKKAIEYCKL